MERQNKTKNTTTIFSIHAAVQNMYSPTLSAEDIECNSRTCSCKSNKFRSDNLYFFSPLNNKVRRSRQDSNLREETPMDFESIALTTWPHDLTTTEHSFSYCTHCILHTFWQDALCVWVNDWIIYSTYWFKIQFIHQFIQELNTTTADPW